MANTEAVNSSTPAICYKRHRFPKEIISHAVWLYYRFTLSGIVKLTETGLLSPPHLGNDGASEP